MRLVFVIHDKPPLSVQCLNGMTRVTMSLIKLTEQKNGNIYENVSVEADGIKFTINKAEVKESDNEVIIYVLE